MALSPLKSPAGGFSRRRRGFNWTYFWLPLIGLGLFMGWRWLFGFDSALNSAVKAMHKGNPAEASRMLAELVQKRPNHPRVTDALGMLENTLGRPLAARDLYIKAVSLGLNAAGAMDHDVEGLVNLDNARYESAEVEYQHAVNLDPSNAQAQLGLGWCLQARGLYNEALASFNKALTIDPSLEDARRAVNGAEGAISRRTHFYIYDRDGEPLARQAFDDNGFGQKSYPQNQYTSHIIGLDTKRLGKLGLEKHLDGLLPSNSVQLTISSRLQSLVAKHMGWRKGSVVVMNPKTGEILAAVSQPMFRPNRGDQDFYKIHANRNKPLKNRAMEGLYEPGSICKIITAAAALETHVDMSKIFPIQKGGAVKFAGKWFRDWKDHGKVNSLKQAMEVSSNIALAYVAFELGSDKHFEYTNKFGFGRQFDLGFSLGTHRYDIPLTASTATLAGDNKFDMAERACGLGKDYRITPIHAAMLAGVIANKGVLMQPSLIKKVSNIAGHTLWENKPTEDSRAVSLETAEKMKEIMIATVEEGLGIKAAVEGIKVAGKTGTSRTRKGGGLDAWFIGFAPADNPQVAIAVFGDEEGQGKDIAAPIAGAILKDWVR